MNDDPGATGARPDQGPRPRSPTLTDAILPVVVLIGLIWR